MTGRTRGANVERAISASSTAGSRTTSWSVQHCSSSICDRWQFDDVPAASLTQHMCGRASDWSGPATGSFWLGLWGYCRQRTELARTRREELRRCPLHIDHRICLPTVDFPLISRQLDTEGVVPHQIAQNTHHITKTVRQSQEDVGPSARLACKQQAAAHASTPDEAWAQDDRITLPPLRFSSPVCVKGWRASQRTHRGWREATVESTQLLSRERWGQANFFPGGSI